MARLEFSSLKLFRPIRVEYLLHPLIKDFVLQLIHSRISFEADVIKQDRPAVPVVKKHSDKLVSVKSVDTTILAATEGLFTKDSRLLKLRYENFDLVLPVKISAYTRSKYLAKQEPHVGVETIPSVSTDSDLLTIHISGSAFLVLYINECSFRSSGPFLRQLLFPPSSSVSPPPSNLTPLSPATQDYISSYPYHKHQLYNKCTSQQTTVHRPLSLPPPNGQPPAKSLA